MYQKNFIPFLKNIMWSQFQNIFSLHLKYIIFKKKGFKYITQYKNIFYKYLCNA